MAQYLGTLIKLFGATGLHEAVNVVGIADLVNDPERRAALLAARVFVKTLKNSYFFSY